MNSGAGQSPRQRRIVDAHHHLWDLSKNYHPWLCDATPIPFRYGEYTAIRKNYLLPDYLNDAKITKYKVVFTLKPSGTP